MNGFNRAAMAVLALVLLAAAVFAALLAAHVVVPPACLGTGFLGDAARRLAAVGDTARLTTFVILTAIAVGAVLLLVLELAPRGGGRSFLVQQGEAGTLTIERVGVCRLAEKVAGESSGVVGARASVSEVEGGIAVRLGLTVAATTNVPEVGADVQKRVRAAIERQVGLTAREVDVDTRIAPEPPAPPRPKVE